jgi:hypothetical protein
MTEATTTLTRAARAMERVSIRVKSGGVGTESGSQLQTRSVARRRSPSAFSCQRWEAVLNFVCEA